MCDLLITLVLSPPIIGGCYSNYNSILQCVHHIEYISMRGGVFNLTDGRMSK